MQIIDKDTVVDTLTGECIEEPGQIMDLVFETPRTIASLTGYDGSTPLYRTHLEQIDLPPAKKAAMLASYVAAQPLPLTDFTDREIEICGAILYESGRYIANDGRQTVMDGYGAILLKTNMFQNLELKGSARVLKKRIILSCSGKYLAQWALPAMEALGWFDWQEAIKVVFQQDSSKRVSVVLIEE